MRLKEHRDACEKGMVEKSAVAEYPWENHHPINWEESTVLDHSRGQELLVKEVLHNPDDTLRGMLQMRWRTGSPWLLDHCDEEAGREEQSSPTFDLQ